MSQDVDGGTVSKKIIVGDGKYREYRMDKSLQKDRNPLWRTKHEVGQRISEIMKSKSSQITELRRCVDKLEKTRAQWRVLAKALNSSNEDFLLDIVLSSSEGIEKFEIENFLSSESWAKLKSIADLTEEELKELLDDSGDAIDDEVRFSDEQLSHYDWIRQIVDACGLQEPCENTSSNDTVHDREQENGEFRQSDNLLDDNKAKDAVKDSNCNGLAAKEEKTVLGADEKKENDGNEENGCSTTTTGQNGDIEKEVLQEKSVATPQTEAGKANIVADQTIDPANDLKEKDSKEKSATESDKLRGNTENLINNDGNQKSESIGNSQLETGRTVNEETPSDTDSKATQIGQAGEAKKEKETGEGDEFEEDKTAHESATETKKISTEGKSVEITRTISLEKATLTETAVDKRGSVALAAATTLINNEKNGVWKTEADTSSTMKSKPGSSSFSEVAQRNGSAKQQGLLVTELYSSESYQEFPELSDSPHEKTKKQLASPNGLPKLRFSGAETKAEPPVVKPVSPTPTNVWAKRIAQREEEDKKKKDLGEQPVFPKLVPDQLNGAKQFSKPTTEPFKLQFQMKKETVRTERGTTSSQENRQIASGANGYVKKANVKKEPVRTVDSEGWITVAPKRNGGPVPNEFRASEPTSSGHFWKTSSRKVPAEQTHSVKENARNCLSSSDALPKASTSSVKQAQSAPAVGAPRVPPAAATPNVPSAAAAPKVPSAAAAPKWPPAAAARKVPPAAETSQAPSAAATPQVPSAAATPKVPLAVEAPRVPPAAATPNVPSAAAAPQVPSAAPKVPSAAAAPKVPPPVEAPRVPPAAAAPKVPSAAAAPQVPSAAPKVPSAAAAPKVPPAAAAQKVPPAAETSQASSAAATPHVPSAAATPKVPPAAETPKVPPAAATPEVPPAAAAPKVPPAAATLRVPTAAETSQSPPAGATPNVPSAAAAPQTPSTSAVPEVPPAAAALPIAAAALPIAAAALPLAAAAEVPEVLPAANAPEVPSTAAAPEVSAATESPQILSAAEAPEVLPAAAAPEVPAAADVADDAPIPPVDRLLNNGAPRNQENAPRAREQAGEVLEVRHRRRPKKAKATKERGAVSQEEMIAIKRREKEEEHNRQYVQKQQELAEIREKREQEANTRRNRLPPLEQYQDIVVCQESIKEHFAKKHFTYRWISAKLYTGFRMNKLALDNMSISQLKFDRFDEFLNNKQVVENMCSFMRFVQDAMKKPNNQFKLSELIDFLENSKEKNQSENLTAIEQAINADFRTFQQHVKHIRTPQVMLNTKIYVTSLLRKLTAVDGAGVENAQRIVEALRNFQFLFNNVVVFVNKCSYLHSRLDLKFFVCEEDYLLAFAGNYQDDIDFTITDDEADHPIFEEDSDEGCSVQLTDSSSQTEEKDEDMPHASLAQLRGR